MSKRVFQENKAHQVFRKTNISYPLIRIRTRFEIRLVALLPTIHSTAILPHCLTKLEVYVTHRFPEKNSEEESDIAKKIRKIRYHFSDVIF